MYIQPGDPYLDVQAAAVKCTCNADQVCNLCPERKRQAMIRQNEGKPHPAKTLRAINRKRFIEIQRGMEARLKRPVSRRDVQAFIDHEANVIRERLRSEAAAKFKAEREAQ